MKKSNINSTSDETIAVRGKPNPKPEAGADPNPAYESLGVATPLFLLMSVINYVNE